MKRSQQLRGLAGAKPVLAALGLLTYMGTQALPQVAASADPGRRAITGAVERPLNLQISDLEKMSHVSVEVKDHDGTLTTYEGVPLAELLKAAGAPIGEKLRGANMASYVLAEAKDGYRVVFALGRVCRERKAVARWPGAIADRRATGKAPSPLDSYASENTGRENTVVS